MAENGAAAPRSFGPADLWREIRHQHRVFWRNPVSIAFTIALPLVTLPLLEAINRGAFVETPAARFVLAQAPPGGWERSAGWVLMGLHVPFAQYLAPVSAAYAVAIACIANLATRTAVTRDLGILKRVRGTPLPAGLYVAGQVGASVSLAALMVAGAIGIGVVAWDVELVPRLLPAAVLVLLVGVASFCALGLALGSLLPNASAAPAVSYTMLLPLGLLSAVFFPPQIAPGWMRDLGGILPLQPFGQALFATFSPDTAAPGILWAELAKVVAWGALGAAVAARRFRSERR